MNHNSMYNLVEYEAQKCISNLIFRTETDMDQIYHALRLFIQFESQKAQFENDIQCILEAKII